MPRTTTDERIKALESKIAAIKAKAESKRQRADPAIKLMKAGLKSLERAIGATEDKVLRQQLDGARETVSACLGLVGVTVRGSRNTMTPRARRVRPTSSDNGEGNSTPDANDLLAYVQNNPGSNSERISAAFSTDSGTLRPVMRRLIDEGKVKTKGERRGMRYFVGA